VAHFSVCIMITEWVSKRKDRSGMSIFQSDEPWAAFMGGGPVSSDHHDSANPLQASTAAQPEEEDDAEYRTRGGQKKSSFGFELHAYEALLTVVKSLEFQEYDTVKAHVRAVVEGCQQTGGYSLLPIDMQENMRELKNDLSRMLSRVGSSQRVLQDAVADDEEMAMMNLTLLKSKPELYR